MRPRPLYISLVQWSVLEHCHVSGEIYLLVNIMRRLCLKNQRQNLENAFLALRRLKTYS